MPPEQIIAALQARFSSIESKVGSMKSLLGQYQAGSPVGAYSPEAVAALQDLLNRAEALDSNLS